MFDNLYVRNDIQYVVANKQAEKLSDYVRRVISETNSSYRKVAAASGGAFTHTTVSEIINNPATDPTVSVLIGLAKGLKVPEDEVFAVARGNKLDSDGFSKDIERLTNALPLNRQEDLLEIAKTFFNMETRNAEAVGEQIATVPPERQFRQATKEIKKSVKKDDKKNGEKLVPNGTNGKTDS